MDELQLIKARHSVRQFTTVPLKDDVVTALTMMIDGVNAADSGLYFQLVTNDPDTFGKSMLASYGKFSNVSDYILVAATDDAADEAGYQGERLVLEALKYGVGSCWVGLTFSKKALNRRIDHGAMAARGAKVRAVIALGYPAVPGRQHPMKDPRTVAADYDTAPEWYRHGVDAVLLAPSALNKQPYDIRMVGDDTVRLRIVHGLMSLAKGYAPLDRGIARLHFAIGARHPVTII